MPIDEGAVLITGSGMYVPPEVITNDELVESFNTYVQRFNEENKEAIEAGMLEPKQESSSQFIAKASGIERRHVVQKAGILDVDRLCPYVPESPDSEMSIQCEMAIPAARQAMAEAGKQPSDIDLVIAASATLQRLFPGISMEVQEMLGIEGYGFDMNVACSSATFALDLAYRTILTGGARAVLVINPEVCTGFANFRDRDSHFIFGDACSAMVVERADLATQGGFRILDTRMVTKFSNNIRTNFGLLNRFDESGIGKDDKLFYQQGRRVFKEVCPMVANLIRDHLESQDLGDERLKRLWLHQANINMDMLIARKVFGRQVSHSDAPTVLQEYANTSSAGSILAFHENKADLTTGDIGVICSFGGGYSIGSVIVERT